MDRRSFVKKIGIGGLLVGLGAFAGLGCSEQGSSAPVTGPPEEGDTMTAVCPTCQADNRVETWGAEIKCWKCGHEWAPQEPA
ncbi:MAG: twin-arginine translocation signal domain-containing protein [Armatimonadota bacterium]